MKAEQGELLNIAGIADPAIVVSNNFFNEEEMAVICPVVNNATEGALHIRLNHHQVEGVVLCEQMKVIDLRARRFSKLGIAEYHDVLNIADAVMGIFDYQVF